MRSKRVRTLCACNRTRDTNAEYNVIRDINADDTAPGIRSPLPVFEPHALPLTHITHRPWFLGGITQAYISFSIQSHSLAYCAGARNRIRNCINRQKKNNSASRSKRNKYDVRFGGKQRNWTNSLGWCVCEWFSLLALQYPWIYVGGFWLIDIHSVDIIYNGIQFALNHSPNASESISNERAYRKRNRKNIRRDENETRRFRSACNLFHSSHTFDAFFLSLSIFLSRFIVPPHAEPVSQHNTFYKREFKYKFWMDSFSKSLQLQAMLAEQKKNLIFLVLVRPTGSFFHSLFLPAWVRCSPLGMLHQ